MRTTLFAFCLAATSFQFSASLADEKMSPSYDPKSAYESRTIEGWTVLVNRRLVEETKLCDDTLKLLGTQLYQITRVVPVDAVTKLKTVPLWVELAHPKHPCMCYHPDAGWLKANDMNPEKARAVELSNARNFLKWTIDQPWMVFHELAHAYHDRFIEKGYGNDEISEAHRKAVDAGKYNKVERIGGQQVKHYATTNPMEYFAEASESYFGVNDYYPFVRPELARHDAAAVPLLEKLWGVGRK